jgi:SAM-dependent methyltransferase
VRKQHWAGIIGGSALIGAIVALMRRRFRLALAMLTVAIAADRADRVWSRRDPAPLPALLRWVLYTPHPDGPLRRALVPQPGEHVLEVGPGLGQYAVRVATWVGPDGRVDVLDVQQEMLDATMRTAQRKHVDNITPTLGTEPGHFAYPDATFDAAYLNSVLGEMSDQHGALSELRRVLKADGRLVVGEVGFDPDFVSLHRLQKLAEAAGFRFDRRDGPPFAYFARFVPA